MAQRFTYDEFQRELTNSGLGSEFSAADLKLAQQNPDAGMSILKYKRDYHNATTPEQRALANLGAEGIRSSYGNYTGGGAGSQFYLDPLSPNSFQQDAKPTYSSNRTGLVDDLLNKQLNYGDYSRIANDVQTASALEQLDYTKYLNELNQYNTDRSFSYQNLLDEINQQTGLRGEALEKAQLAAQYGDYSYLRKLGIDTSAYEAALAAKGARSSGGGSGSGSAGGSKINGGGSYSGNVAMARDSYNGVQRTISTLLGQGNYDRAYDVAVGARGQMSKQQWSDVAKRIYEVSGIKIDDSVKYK